MTMDPRRPIYVVDDDVDLAASLARFLQRSGHEATPFSDPEALLATYASAPAACVIVDIMMGSLNGFDFADRLRALDAAVAVIFMTAFPKTSAAVDAVRRHGGIDYLQKPIDEQRMLDSLREGLAWSERQRDAALRTTTLTARERDVFALLAQGHSSKVIATKLGISPRTVEDHRASIAAKTGTSTVAQLIALHNARTATDGRS